MKTFKQLKKSSIILLGLVIIGCGAETVAALIFLPAFSATWAVEGDPEYFIDLRGNEGEEKVSSGPITGFEDHDSDPERQLNDLQGSFDNLDIEFTIQRPTGNVQYTGKMIPVSEENHAITRIELQSSEGPLVLVF